MMKRRTHNRRTRSFYIIAACILLLFSLAGCGSADGDALDVYRAEMETFYNEVSDINSEINAIDPESEDAAVTLLAALDRLDRTFADMAAIEIPEEFAVMGDLPEEAADYMSRAVESYHEAYDGDFDEDAEALAEQYYERANVRIRYMLAILHGEAEVTVEEEE